MKRREFMRKAGIAAAGIPFMGSLLSEEVRASIPADIKVTDVKVFPIRSDFYVKLYTNKGVTGLGTTCVDTMEEALHGAINDLSHLVIGRDPTNLEFLWQAMFRWPRQRGGIVSNAAISAYDMALWDIIAKLMDAPLYKVLGGAARDKVRIYVHCNSPRTPEAMKEGVIKLKEQGFNCIRCGINWAQPFTVMERPWDFDLAVSLIRAMREGAGNDVDIFDDAHGLMTEAMVLEYCKAIEQYRPLFIEDPVKEENMDGLRWIQSHTSIPIMIGESIYTRFSYFREIISDHLANCIHPDVKWAGGISECKKLATMAEPYFIEISLHGGYGPLENLAMTHISANAPNATVQEYQTRLSQEMLDLFKGDNIRMEDGYILLPEKPGIGCDIDEALAAKIEPRRGTRPFMTTEDGAVMDW